MVKGRWFALAVGFRRFRRWLSHVPDLLLPALSADGNPVPAEASEAFLFLFQGVFDLLALLIQLLQLVVLLGDFFIVQNLNAFNLLLGILPNLLFLYSLLKDFGSILE